LWSGLTILKPRTGSEDDSAQRRRLRRARRLFTPGVPGPRCTVDAIRPLEVAKPVEEYEGRQWEKNIAVEAANLRAINRVACPVR
jgi:hypothetical protein